MGMSRAGESQALAITDPAKLKSLRDKLINSTEFKELIR